MLPYSELKNKRGNPRKNKHYTSSAIRPRGLELDYNVMAYGRNGGVSIPLQQI